MKRTLWEGGVRGVGFVHGDGFLSRSVRGSILDGMFHAVDWFPTVLHAAASATGLGDVAAAGCHRSSRTAWHCRVF